LDGRQSSARQRTAVDPQLGQRKEAEQVSPKVLQRRHLSAVEQQGNEK
jgi:hypothetical protein